MTILARRAIPASTPNYASNDEPRVSFDEWCPPGRWVDRARCLGSCSPAFFPERGGASKPARLICARCPVWRECLEYATWTINAKEGIWGGATTSERQHLRSGYTTVAIIRQRLDDLICH